MSPSADSPRVPKSNHLLAGFQAFNINPSTKSLSQHHYVPSSLFLASDHLVELISQEMLRVPLAEPPISYLHKLSRSVWELHSKILHSYSLWLDNVKIKHPRTLFAQSILQNHAWDDPATIRCLLIELSTYFLLWTEAANLRHCPELLWFLYHIMTMSPSTSSLWSNALLAQRPVVSGARGRRVLIRNLWQAEIHTNQTKFRHQPANLSIRECLEFLLNNRLPHPSTFAATTGTSLTSILPGDSEIWEDLVAMGDGGLFTSHIIGPIFTVMAYEVRE